MNAIDVNDLHKAYGGLLSRRKQWALRGVSLTVSQGSSFGLIGPNGAGKTTFIKALLAIVRVEQGTINIFGASPETPRVRARVGYLPERLHFGPGVTPLSFLTSVARLRGIGDIRGEAHRQLARVGLHGEANRKVSGFSKGMRQRLGLAAALLGAPDMLILDEPTDGIDPMGRREVRQLLRDEQARGATILLNSHLLDETERSCDRIGILVGGRLLLEGDIDTLCRSETEWRVRFADGAQHAPLESIGFIHDPAAKVWRLSAPSPQRLNMALAAAHDTGALLTELTPYMRTLEDILADTVGAQTP